ncbi:hypothetical protein [Streptomyces nojiriensis]|uniref:hypothetical protein n=1 Tax=Streptomyces nojiriensis TaxID=66374 RepID=UPI001673656A|nr:hypothetical protein [Streptomyces nojiriensis]
MFSEGDVDAVDVGEFDFEVVGAGFSFAGAVALDEAPADAELGRDGSGRSGEGRYVVRQ